MFVVRMQLHINRNMCVSCAVCELAATSSHLKCVETVFNARSKKKKIALPSSSSGRRGAVLCAMWNMQIVCMV